jgi:hypothetical protein
MAAVAKPMPYTTQAGLELAKLPQGVYFTLVL